MTGLVIDHIPFDLEAEIVAAMHASLERDRVVLPGGETVGEAKDRERAIRETATAYRMINNPHWRAYARRQALKAAGFNALAFVLMMGVAAVAEMRMGGVL